MKLRLLNYVPLISNRTKILISTGLLLLAFSISIFRPESLDSKLCLLAMFFSFIGDIALNCTPLEKRPHSLLYIGAFFFMVSHLIYASAYYLLINNFNKAFVNTGSYIAYYFMAFIFIASIACMYLTKKTIKVATIIFFYCTLQSFQSTLSPSVHIVGALEHFPL